MSDYDDDEGGPSFDMSAEFFRDTIAGMEQRQLLEKVGRDAAEVIIDLEKGGPLGKYVSARRGEAAESLRALVELDPRDAVGIALAQSAVKEFLRACDWIAARMDEATQAEMIIKRDYDGEHEQND